MEPQSCDKYTNKGSAGQAALTTVILLLFVSLTIGSGISAIALKETRVSKINTRAKESYFLAESGIEDVLYRVRTNKKYSPTETLTLNNVTAVTTITDVGTNEKQIVAQGDSAQAIRNLDIRLHSGVGTSFVYGVQVGNGGLFMENNTRVNGSIYSNGNITGENNPLITGDALLAGASTVSNVSVGGTIQTGLTPLPMPIPDTQLDQWEQDAQAGGIITGPCPYQPNNGALLGPIKITCDLLIDGDKNITLTGALWVQGNFHMQNNSILRLSSSFGASSGVVIVDNPANRVASSKILIENNTQILGSGDPKSYVLLASRNNAIEMGNNTEAIDVKNGSSAPIYYAPHGLVMLQNNVTLKEVTAYKIHMKNLAELTYESGLANVNFSTGPTGGWEIIDWKEVP
ncbi:MAG: hypothetical protein AAB604_03145 [Patescibacteria group bacterium]